MFPWFKSRPTWLVDQLLTPSNTPPSVSGLLADNERRAIIIGKLAALGSSGIKALLSRAGFEGEDDLVIGQAIRECGEEALRALTQLADESALSRRRALIKTLWQFDDAASGAVPWLIQTLDDSDPEVRALTAQALGRVGPAAVQAAEKLVAVDQNDEPHARSRAMWALTQIGPDPAIATQVFLKALMESDPEVVKSGAHGLTKLTFDPRPYRSHLVQRVCSTVFRSHEAFKLLARCDGFPPEEVQALFDLGIRDPGDPEIARFRTKLVNLLWRQTHDPAWVFPLIDRMLREDDPEWACEALDELGPAGLPYAGRLLDLMEARPDDWNLARLTVDAIAGMGPAAVDYLPRIERLRSHPSERVLRRAEQAIRRLRGERGP